MVKLSQLCLIKMLQRGLRMMKKKKKGEGDMKEEEKLLLTVVLKVDMDRNKDQILKYVASFDGVEAVTSDNNDLTIVGDVDPIAIVSKLRKRYFTVIKAISRQVKAENINTNDPGRGSVGYDNNSGGGGGRRKDGSNVDGGDKSEGGGDDDGNRNIGDKSEGSGGSGKLKGFKLEYMGERGFDYKYGYHAGYEDGYLVGIMMAIVGINQKVAAAVVMGMMMAIVGINQKVAAGVVRDEGLQIRVCG